MVMKYRMLWFSHGNQDESHVFYDLSQWKTIIINSKKNIELNSFITHNDSYKLSELWVKHLHLDDTIDLPLKASFKRLKEPPPNPRVTTVRCTAAPLRLLARLVEGRRWRWSRGGNALHQQRALREENGWCLWCIWFVWYVIFLCVYIYICGCVLSNINMCIYMCVYVLLNIYICVCVFYLIYIYMYYICSIQYLIGGLVYLVSIHFY